MFKRLVKLSKSHSFFLFGARATGKSTLLQRHFKPDETLWIDLLDPEIEERLSRYPSQLNTMIDAAPGKKWIVIDEIQKIPKLLDVVHQLTKNKNIKFALTGSSARKLKRGEANLLAGRAFNYVCHPLIHTEIGDHFILNDVLSYGSLPEVFQLAKSDKLEFLRAYVDTYFREEIVAEQIVRKLKPFKSFLQVAAQMNGKILNINKIARDVGVDNSTVQNYFEILEDTLVGFLLEPYSESVRKRQRQAAKFYYFDIGVTRALNRTLELSLTPSTYEYGAAFEQFLILEIKRLIDYTKPDWRLSYLRTKDGAEIDLIIERPGLSKVLIEIKSTNRVDDLKDSKTRAFFGLAHDIKKSQAFVLSQDPVEKKVNGVWYLPWQRGLAEIGLDQLQNFTV
jgi:uncharacterized protein